LLTGLLALLSQVTDRITDIAAISGWPNCWHYCHKLLRLLLAPIFIVIIIIVIITIIVKLLRALQCLNI